MFLVALYTLLIQNQECNFPVSGRTDTAGHCTHTHTHTHTHTLPTNNKNQSMSKGKKFVTVLIKKNPWSQQSEFRGYAVLILNLC